MTNPVPKVAVIQDGSRLHYAVPAALQRQRLLERVYTEWYGPPRTLRHLAAAAFSLIMPAAGNRMKERWSPDLDDHLVETNVLLTIREQLRRRRFATSAEYYLWASEQVANWVLDRGFGDANAVFGFVRNIHPRLCQAARGKGMAVVVDQMIAPARVEARALALQQERFPGWEEKGDASDEAAASQLEEQTWAAATHITCASDYVRNGMIAQNIAPDRISVIQYPLDCTKYPAYSRPFRRELLTVGFVGAVNLRKGAPCFLNVARQLRGRGMRFVMVGPIRLAPKIVDEYRDVVDFVGPVPRSEVARWLGMFDIFFFPSTCEGSAGAVMEAMAMGLPVVTTPSSGSIVQDGVHGFIREPDDTDGSASAIALLAQDLEMRLGVGQQARAAAEVCDLCHYGSRLAACIARAVSRS